MEVHCNIWQFYGWPQQFFQNKDFSRNKQKRKHKAGVSHTASPVVRFFIMDPRQRRPSSNKTPTATEGLGSFKAAEGQLHQGRNKVPALMGPVSWMHSANNLPKVTYCANIVKKAKWQPHDKMLY